MERKSRVLDPVVIGQDDQTELHVQAVIQGGRRHLDIRVWRRGPTGFAPSRNAITLDATDLDALQEGIAELLEASSGGTQVARVVWDKDEGRRLRAETEPFGTRYLARLGFWQRVRDSWKPAGEGLVLSAEKLRPLQALLRDIRPRLEPEVESREEPLDPNAEAAEDERLTWPAPGADWITVRRDSVALHPRGIRITAEVEDSEDTGHRLVLRQWRREDSLWLTTDEMLRLDLADLDGILDCVRELMADTEAEDMPGRQIPIATGSTVWVRVLHPAQGAPGTRGDEAELRLDELPPVDGGVDTGYEPRLHLPASHLGKFGRLLWQSRIMLIRSLSREERERLLSAEELAELIGPPESQSGTAETNGSAEQPAETGADIGQDRVVLQEATMIAWEPAPLTATTPGTRNPVPAASAPQEEPRRTVSLGDIKLGPSHVFLFLQETEPRELSLQWEGRSLKLPVDHLEELISRVRDLYYDALRGRRGRAANIGTRPAITVSVHHQGSIMYLALDQDIDGKTTHLSFPTGEVPAFLNVTEAAVARI